MKQENERKPSNEKDIAENETRIKREKSDDNKVLCLPTVF